MKEIKQITHYFKAFETQIIRRRMWKYYNHHFWREISDKSFFRKFEFFQSDASFINDFKAAAKYNFFFSIQNRKDFFLQTLTSLQPHEKIIAQAEDVVKNKFETLGSGKVHLGEKIDWQRDFKTGKIWEKKFYSEIDYADLGNPTDVKVPWELSRFHQLAWLGKAYWLTNYQPYAEKFRELIEDWIEENPVGYGVNWTTPMEIAIRACNWIMGFYFFNDSKRIPDEFWVKFLKSLYWHGLFIRNNLEHGRRNGNHYISDAVGLVFLGMLFKNTNFSRKWLSIGVGILETEMMCQVYSDGVDYEKSTSYHRLVLELFYSAYLLCERNGVMFSSGFEQRLEKMFDFVLYYTKPDGTCPLIGDADDGRLFKFSAEENINDHRHVLSIGAVVFNRADLKKYSGAFSQDALWLLQAEGYEKFRLMPDDTSPLLSRAFPQGGFYIMRHHDAYCFIDGGDIGMNGWGGHGHNDTLSFELAVDGDTFITDSGTYAYTFDTEARQEFRRPQSHNTIVVDGKEIAELKSLWRIVKDHTNPKVLTWSLTNEEDIFEAEHYGYTRFAHPVTHRRKIIFNKTDRTWIIEDRLFGIGAHQCDFYLHLAPHITVEEFEKNSLLGKGNHEQVILKFDSPFEILEGWVSKSYGVRERARVVKISKQGNLPLQFVTHLHLGNNVRISSGPISETAR